MAVNVTRKARTLKFQFGPGALESIDIVMHCRRRDAGGDRFVVMKIEGEYAVYCGGGGTHWVYIDTKTSGWTQESHSDTSRMLTAAYVNQDVDAAEGLVHELINDELYDFSCECMEAPDQLVAA